MIRSTVGTVAGRAATLVAPLRPAESDAPRNGNLMSINAARRVVLDLVSCLPAEESHPAGATGQVLAEAVRARLPVPTFDNAAMDGYAVAAADIRGDTLPADAAPIATGAPLPLGTDAVVPVELVRADGRCLMVRGRVRAGDHVRRRGEELSAGALVLDAGEPLTAAAVGVLCGLGLSRVRVHRRPRVAILVTGDEVHRGAQSPSPGSIPDANGPMLVAAAAEAGCIVVEIVHAPDDRRALSSHLVRLAAVADVVCTSGGASVGRRDHLTGLVAELGRLVVHQLATKPGRPASVGLVGETPVIVLPGNPLALLVGFELLLRPALRRLAGAGDPYRPRVRVSAGASLPVPTRDRACCVPVRLMTDPTQTRAEAVDALGPAMLSGAAHADGMAILPAAEPAARPSVEVELWRA